MPALDDPVVCGVCGGSVTVGTILEHLRDEHGIEDEFETWPDGQPVIVDRTLEPGDFTVPDAR